MLGALCHYISHASPRDFQPMKANFGIMPPLEAAPRHKSDRKRAYAERADRALEEFLSLHTP
jgi:methylenetetrahydrofolate--tRNA-(uracil-5-)-methyltransferase